MRDETRSTVREAETAMPVSAIRTPGEFVAALERALVLADDPAKDGAFRGIAEAVREAPFLIHCGQVVPKGFTPRIVR